MPILMNKNSITISKESVKKRGGIVILDLKEYQELCRKAIPTYYLSGKKAEEIDKLVEEGLREYKEGKTINASSLREALNVYEKKNRQNKKHRILKKIS